MDLPDYADVAAAVTRIAPFARRTPLLSSPRLDAMMGGRLLIKAEPLQVTGSFKYRRATNAVQMLADDVTTVVAWSSGNHAQAVACAARTRGIKAIIVMPEDAPEAKKQGTTELGGEVVTYNRYTESREEIGAALAERHKATVIPPFDYLPVIAGQGTIGVEMAEQLRDENITPDQVICCTGGGGLLAGLCLGLHESFPDVPIYGAEPEGFDDFAQSLAAGERQACAPEARSICDAIVTPMPGKMTFPINKEHVTGGLVVSDDDALMAMALAWQHLKLVVEPGGAVALAAALTGKIDITGKTTVVVASGGNVDQPMFERALKML
ncbi:MAG: threonine/serine dehydratase [Alphaproteobacteria bacterium]|nr:threonine/serine dehydratase [Alphaproteobacteria bacterium]